MGLFNKQEGVISGSMAARMRPTEPKPVQEIAMVIEYFDKTTARDLAILVQSMLND